MPAPPDLVAFCREQHPRLVGILGLYCGDRVVAEELAQEALTRTCRDWKRVRAKDDPGAWVSRVAINLANSFFRRKLAERRATARLEGQRRAGSEPDLSVSVSLRQAIAKLPPRQRMVLILHYYLDLPFSEVANYMDIPLSTAKSLSKRATARLRSDSGLFQLREAPDGR
ncbi:MAG: SigE family RNA polymerase sigma factor [Actinomycetota bacterium]